MLITLRMTREVGWQATDAVTTHVVLFTGLFLNILSWGKYGLGLRYMLNKTDWFLSMSVSFFGTLF